jgi:hypothetical protein
MILIQKIHSSWKKLFNVQKKFKEKQINIRKTMSEIKFCKIFLKKLKRTNYKCLNIKGINQHLKILIT